MMFPGRHGLIRFGRVRVRSHGDSRHSEHLALGAARGGLLRAPPVPVASVGVVARTRKAVARERGVVARTRSGAPCPSGPWRVLAGSWRVLAGPWRVLAGPWPVRAGARLVPSGSWPVRAGARLVPSESRVDDRRSVYFGRDRARPPAGRGAVLMYGDDPRRRDREGIGRKTPAFYEPARARAPSIARSSDSLDWAPTSSLPSTHRVGSANPPAALNSARSASIRASVAGSATQAR